MNWFLFMLLGLGAAVFTGQMVRRLFRGEAPEPEGAIRWPVRHPDEAHTRCAEWFEKAIR
jgi:hypothetical protein